MKRAIGALSRGLRSRILSIHGDDDERGCLSPVSYAGLPGLEYVGGSHRSERGDPTWQRASYLLLRLARVACWILRRLSGRAPLHRRLHRRWRPGGDALPFHRYASRRVPWRSAEWKEDL